MTMKMISLFESFIVVSLGSSEFGMLNFNVNYKFFVVTFDKVISKLLFTVCFRLSRFT